MSRLTNKLISKRNGFTLIELLIVVAILGILYSVALPSYTEHMERSRRADIQQVLLQHGAILERIYSRNGGYPNSFSVDNTEYYDFTYKANLDGGADFKSKKYTLKAKPKSAQSNDRCGELVIKQDGTHSAAAAGCWD